MPDVIWDMASCRTVNRTCNRSIMRRTTRNLLKHDSLLIGNASNHCKSNEKRVNFSQTISGSRFSAYQAPLQEPYTISIDKPSETKYKFNIELSKRRKRIFNKRNENCIVQILLRVGKVTLNEIEWDRIPYGFVLEINKSMVVSNVSSPVNLVHYVRQWPKFKPVTVTLSWLPELTDSYRVTLDWLVVRNPSLFGKYLISKGYRWNGVPKKCIETAKDVEILSEEATLLCPLTMKRLVIAVQGDLCNHVQCFDGLSYLRMNLTKPKWTCPICRSLSYPSSLAVEGYWTSLLDSCPTDSVIIRSDGTWNPIHRSEESTIPISLEPFTI